MMLNKTVSGFILLSFLMDAHAGTMGSVSNNYFISLSGGPSWTNAGSRQTVALQPDLIKTYVPQDLTNSNMLGNGEIFAGIQRSFFPEVQSQFGLAFYLSSAATLNGFIQEDGDPNFQNYSYQYRISHGHIALKTKWIAENSYNLNPYLSGSIGVSFNRSYGYVATPLIFQEIDAPPFHSHTKTAFTYSVGVGFQHTVSQHLSVGVGYQLVSWGSSALARADGQTTGKGLSLGNLYTQGVELNLSYFL